MKEFYLARDKDGNLCMFNHKPVTFGRVFSIENGMGYSANDYCSIESEFFPEVTFENSLVKIEIKICEDGKK